MQSHKQSTHPIEQEVLELRQRLEEAEEALRAIRSGEVDALVIGTDDGDRIYTLQDSEHAYRVMVETMNEGAATLLEDGTILYCNRRLAEMLGTPLEQMPGASFYRFLGPQEQEQFSRLVSQAVKTEARAELVLLADPLPPLPALLSMRTLPIEGEHPAVCLIVTGLAEQRRSREELEAMVVERTKELAQRNRDLEDFTSVISHDLQEPLRKVKGFGDLLAQNAGEIGPTEIDYIRRMQEATDRMANMIRDLLALSRISTRANPPQSVDLNQVMQEVLSLLEASLERNGGQVEVAALPVIEAEPVQMQQLFQNLISNALKFHQRGQKPYVQVRSRALPKTDRLPARVEITIEDNGIGFEEEHLDVLFQPFKRLVTRKDYEGIGIGLAICKKIVERHGGEITAKSKPGAGATFFVILPEKQI